MKSKLLLITTALGMLSACDRIKGTGQVHKTMQIRKSPNSAELSVVPAGSYNAEMTVDKKTSSLSLKGAAGSFKIKMITPNGLSNNNSFSLSASDIGQTFSMKGVAKTLQSRGPNTSKTESCILRSYQVPYTYCYPDERVCHRWSDGHHDRDHDRDDRRRHEERDCLDWDTIPGSCETRYRTEHDYGSETYYGYNLTSQHTLKVQLIERSQVSASFQFARSPVTRWVTTSSTNCR